MRFCAATLKESLHNDLKPFIDINAPSWGVDSNSKEVACYRLRDSLMKKFNNESKPSITASSRALEKFLKINQKVGDWTLDLNYEWEAELLGELKLVLSDFWLENQKGSIVSDYYQLFSAGRTGPGASIGCRTYDFYSKVFSSEPHTTTSALADIWPTLLRASPFSEAFATELDFPVSVVDYNKLSFVNKNHDMARSICTEPLGNMWLQLGLGSIIERQLNRKFGIDFGIQPEVNAVLAREGSYRDNLVTLDLESASDSLGLRMLQCVLPKDLFFWLLKLRCPSSRLPDGNIVPLNMVSTMGNGFTFPLQTLLFTAACVACYRYLGLRYISSGPWLRRNLAVFGDDIIVDRKVSRILMRLLGILGFTVNSDKSYVEGPFRESCGVDAHLGINVRPVYLKRLRTEQDACVAINRLNRWSSLHDVPLRNSVQYIIHCFPKVRNMPIPLDEDESGGVRTPLRFLSKSPRAIRESPGLLRYSISVPIFFGYRIDDDRLVKHPTGAPFNPRGLEFAFVGGYISGYRVSLRQREVRYKTKRRCTPRWDYLPPEHAEDSNSALRRFAIAFQRNC